MLKKTKKLVSFLHFYEKVLKELMVGEGVGAGEMASSDVSNKKVDKRENR